MKQILGSCFQITSQGGGCYQDTKDYKQFFFISDDHLGIMVFIKEIKKYRN